MSSRTPRPRTVRLALIASTAGALSLTACSGGGGFDSGSGGASQAPAKGPVTITFMITSNGPADVKLQQDVVAGWEKKTGNKVNVVAASDINQQLTQGFAAGSPPDLFFTDANVFPTYAKAGNMVAYGDQVTAKADFYPGLVKTFTYQNKFYCAPKDFSNLALVRSTPTCGRPPASPTPTCRRPGPSWRPSPRSSRVRRQGSGHRRHPRPPRRLHAPGRRLDRQRRPTQDDREHRRRT